MDLTVLAFLACPIAMGLMMWMMMRDDSHQASEDRGQEIAGLRAEIDELRSAQERGRTQEPHSN
ncbi:MAG TPA: hypothetical protein VJ777_04555 [Mycobacterium sp.]|nr:hypothetical protein [Mycobacterium sp.]